MSGAKIPNRRSDNRLDICLPIEMKLESGDTIKLCTRDLSTSGVFLEKGEHDLPPVGSIVELKIGQQLGMGEAPVVKGRIVRETAEGIGICFLTGE
ncbi:MAG: PilZ domain-containing protein [Gammaproteobacteria bacterium]|nr:PilZ domain-containing protein [Gammaproteobacteria bacterium]MDH5651597.1 PilZ domain-containing protein [Gammaproteobacteria bacterium]